MQRTEEALMQSKRTRELNYRFRDGLEVALLLSLRPNEIEEELVGDRGHYFSFIHTREIIFNNKHTKRGGSMSRQASPLRLGSWRL